ncbi:MAG: PHP domain-containing protein [Vicinamibacterales bacterium]
MNGGIVYKVPGRPLAQRFRTGVSLHGHTLHSRERIWFLQALSKRSVALRWLIHSHYRSRSDSVTLAEEFSRIWWTPPLSPFQAAEVETAQIERELEMKALVSLTDHDDIEGPLEVQRTLPEFPISIEWSVRHESTTLHLGVHNLPPASARPLAERMIACGQEPGAAGVDELLQELAEQPGVLVVLNHPFWDLPGIGAENHERCVTRFITRHGQRVHALEINGIRPYQENRSVLALSRATGLPIVSGGDRHGVEPSAVLNVTDASTFAEFAEEVRDRHSQLVVMPQYGEPHMRRVLQTMSQCLAQYPEHPLGWVQWSDRFFRLRQNGMPRSFTEMFDRKGQPLAMRLFVAGVKVSHRAAGLGSTPGRRRATELL